MPTTDRTPKWRAVARVRPWIGLADQGQPAAGGAILQRTIWNSPMAGTIDMLNNTTLLVPEAPGHEHDIEALNARVFGPGRFAKAAYRLREGQVPVSALCAVALDAGRLVGSIRFWTLDIGGAPALLLGPLCVDTARQGQGIGWTLVNQGLERAKAAGHGLVILVGDPPYYARNGFAPVPLGQIQLPGPVDYARLLYVELKPGALAAAKGMARPA